MIKKKKVIFRSKYGDIPVIIRSDCPPGQVFIVSGELEPEDFEMVDFIKGKTEPLKKRFVTNFKPRRQGRLTNVK